MPAKKYSASMDDELLDEVALAAEAAGVTVSAWLTQAARDRLDLLGLQRLVADWQAEHGAFTQEELDEADRVVNEALAANDRQRRETAKRKQAAPGAVSPPRKRGVSSAKARSTAPKNAQHGTVRKARSA